MNPIEHAKIYSRALILLINRDGFVALRLWQFVEAQGLPLRIDLPVRPASITDAVEPPPTIEYQRDEVLSFYEVTKRFYFRLPMGFEKIQTYVQA